MAFARSCVEAPRANSDRIKRSRETDTSPASIFATLDWLDRSSRATWLCVKWRRRRRRRSESASRSFSSMNAASSSDSPRNSRVSPTRQPLASIRFLLGSRIVVLPKSPATGLNDPVWGGWRLLAEYLGDHDGVRIDSVHETPGLALIVDPKFVAPRANRGHGQRVGHRQAFAALEPTKQQTSFESGYAREWWGLDLALKPDQGPVDAVHSPQCMSLLTYGQGGHRGQPNPRLQLPGMAELDTEYSRISGAAAPAGEAQRSRGRRVGRSSNAAQQRGATMRTNSAGQSFRAPTGESKRGRG
jgi:hypothetical protein